MTRALAALALLVAGAVVSLAAVAVHGWWWGLVLAVAATLSVEWALPRGALTRLPYAVGWVVPLGVALLPRREGDYAVAGDLAGYVVIGLGMVVLAVAVGTLPLSRLPRRRLSLRRRGGSAAAE